MKTLIYFNNDEFILATAENADIAASLMGTTTDALKDYESYKVMDSDELRTSTSASTGFATERSRRISMWKKFSAERPNACLIVNKSGHKYHESTDPDYLATRARLMGAHYPSQTSIDYHQFLIESYKNRRIECESSKQSVSLSEQIRLAKVSMDHNVDANDQENFVRVIDALNSILSNEKRRLLNISTTMGSLLMKSNTLLHLTGDGINNIAVKMDPASQEQLDAVYEDVEEFNAESGSEGSLKSFSRQDIRQGLCISLPLTTKTSPSVMQLLNRWNDADIGLTAACPTDHDIPMDIILAHGPALAASALRTELSPPNSSFLNGVFNAKQFFDTHYSERFDSDLRHIAKNDAQLTPNP
ncbi:hypothetical protein AB6D11_06285 [Vibrio splendidus]